MNETTVGVRKGLFTRSHAMRAARGAWLGVRSVGAGARAGAVALIHGRRPMRAFGDAAADRLLEGANALREPLFGFTKEQAKRGALGAWIGMRAASAGMRAGWAALMQGERPLQAFCDVTIDGLLKDGRALLAASPQAGSWAMSESQEQCLREWLLAPEHERSGRERAAKFHKRSKTTQLEWDLSKQAAQAAIVARGWSMVWRLTGSERAWGRRQTAIGRARELGEAWNKVGKARQDAAAFGFSLRASIKREWESSRSVGQEPSASERENLEHLAQAMELASWSGVKWSDGPLARMIQCLQCPGSTTMRQAGYAELARAWSLANIWKWHKIALGKPCMGQAPWDWSELLNEQELLCKKGARRAKAPWPELPDPQTLALATLASAQEGLGSFDRGHPLSGIASLLLAASEREQLEQMTPLPNHAIAEPVAASSPESSKRKVARL